MAMFLFIWTDRTHLWRGLGGSKRNGGQVWIFQQVDEYIEHLDGVTVFWGLRHNMSELKVCVSYQVCCLFENSVCGTAFICSPTMTTLRDLACCCNDERMNSYVGHHSRCLLMVMCVQLWLFDEWDLMYSLPGCNLLLCSLSLLPAAPEQHKQNAALPSVQTCRRPPCLSLQTQTSVLPGQWMLCSFINRDIKAKTSMTPEHLGRERIREEEVFSCILLRLFPQVALIT